MLGIEEARKMIEQLLRLPNFDERSLAKAIGAYPKTIREILNKERTTLTKSFTLSLIKLYCNHNLSASSAPTPELVE